MANFVALTPPLGQQAWGPVLLSAQSGVAIPLTGLGIGLGDFGYPSLSAPFRVLILKKYPGTLFPDPALQDVIPCADPNPAHVAELWDKYHCVLEDPHTYQKLPITNLEVFVERELAEWIAEFDELEAHRLIVIADRTIMGSAKGQSKKRARGIAFQDDALMEESRATKVGKKESATKTTQTSSSVKEKYDSMYPAHLVVDQDEPAYIMARNYLEAYIASNEKYSDRVREIVLKQGFEPITQRCAKFFAWGLKQPIRRFAEPASPVDSFADSEQLDSDEESIFDDVKKAGIEGSPDSDGVINFRPQNQKPSFKFEQSNLGSRVGSFITQMKEANKQLEEDVAAGKSHSLEVDDSDNEHIEMNLGLGVLEEMAESSEEESEDEDEVKKTAVIEEL